MRLPPFSRENMKLQGGHFDHADRMFHDLAETWRSASTGYTADVKELTPEFYYLPTFLENRFDLDLGLKQNGEDVRAPSPTAPACSHSITLVAGHCRGSALRWGSQLI